MLKWIVINNSNCNKKKYIRYKIKEDAWVDSKPQIVHDPLNFAAQTSIFKLILTAFIDDYWSIFHLIHIVKLHHLRVCIDRCIIVNRAHEIDNLKVDVCSYNKKDIWPNEDDADIQDFKAEVVHNLNTTHEEGEVRHLEHVIVVAHIIH